MRNRSSIIQISDFHFPEAILPGGYILDKKDDGFPQNLAHLVSAHPIKNVMKQLLSVLEERANSVAGIIICGDLTSKGDIVGYRNCLSYLNATLELNCNSRWASNQIHAIPGNHDIDRNTNNTHDTDIHEKFVPLIEAWRDCGVPILTTQDVRHTTLMAANKSEVDIFSINSCIGCGEKRYIPVQLKDKLRDLCRADKESVLEWEQLDTPAFLEQDITHLVQEINTLKPPSLAVVVTHHNLLPQVMPRIEIYTEVVNGGLVRSRLSQCQHPVIYCHGHLHQDPIEIVMNPKSKKGLLVSIGCPEFTKGFNIIDIYYTSAGIPLGCKIVPYLCEDDGAVREQQEITVPLRRRIEASSIIGQLGKKILQKLDDNLIRFEDLHKNADFRNVTKKVFSESIDELAWFEYVVIYNREDDHKHWQIKRSAP
jgi:hypothetical protein